MPNNDIHSVPAQAGIGLRTPHYQDFLHNSPDIPWLEIHSENFFGAGGMNAYVLDHISQHYPLSMHGVGLSLGSEQPLDKEHLQQLKNLIRTYQPGLVSEHISWSNINQLTLNDLLPLPYTEESLKVITKNIIQTQEVLDRQILIENPSTYLEYTHSTIHESEFIAEICKQSDCFALLDVNNIYVNHKNHGYMLDDYLQQIPNNRIKEIHLAGHTTHQYEDHTIYIDHHGDYVCDDVWAYFTKTIKTIGPRPTLIEWDSNIPKLDTLLNEAKKAQDILGHYA